MGQRPDRKAVLDWVSESSVPGRSSARCPYKYRWGEGWELGKNVSKTTSWGEVSNDEKRLRNTGLENTRSLQH